MPYPIETRTRLDGEHVVIYPDADGEPMANNTLQFDWVSSLKGELEDLMAERRDVFVAGDLFWYPVQGEPSIRYAPDAMVVFGRPKGYRGSYKQWQEAGIAPQVVFEVLSPSNTFAEMAQKLQWYERYGVQEYYVLDPEHGTATGYVRRDDRLEELPDLNGWQSPLLGIIVEIAEQELCLYRPDKRPFMKFSEITQLHREALAMADAERSRAVAAEQRAEKAEQRMAEAEQHAERLAAKLRALGIDPNAT
jgi:Uma2 family endonuclease